MHAALCALGPIEWLYAADDLGGPLTPKSPPIFAFFVAFHIFIASKHRDFI